MWSWCPGVTSWQLDTSDTAQVQAAVTVTLVFYKLIVGYGRSRANRSWQTEPLDLSWATVISILTRPSSQTCGQSTHFPRLQSILIPNRSPGHSFFSRCTVRSTRVCTSSKTPRPCNVQIEPSPRTTATSRRVTEKSNLVRGLLDRLI